MELDPPFVSYPMDIGDANRKRVQNVIGTQMDRRRQEKPSLLHQRYPIASVADSDLEYIFPSTGVGPDDGQRSDSWICV